MVDKLLKNGYCSQKCAISARAEKAQASVSAAGEKTLEIIDEVKKRFIDELLTPFQSKLEEIRQQGIDKQKRLEEARKSLENLLIRKQDIEKQVETIQAMKWKIHISKMTLPL